MVNWPPRLCFDLAPDEADIHPGPFRGGRVLLIEFRGPLLGFPQDGARETQLMMVNDA